MCLPIWQRCSRYSHAVGENGRYYHIFLPKLIHKNWSLYVHALKVKSSRLTQAFRGRREKKFWGVGGCLSFNTILGERPTPPSFKPSATHHLMPSCPKPTAPEKQPFFSGQKTLSRVKKKIKDQRDLNILLIVYVSPYLYSTFYYEGKLARLCLLLQSGRVLLFLKFIKIKTSRFICTGIW